MERYKIISKDTKTKEVTVINLNSLNSFNAIITIRDKKYFLEKENRKKQTATYLPEKDWVKKYQGKKSKK